MKKNHINGIEHFESNTASAVYLLLDNDLHFQGKTFGILFDLGKSRKWGQIEQTLLFPQNRKSRICHRMWQ